MIKYKESRISAHHNYLVNNVLTPGFVVGDPHDECVFYFLADLVLPGESTPRISARIVSVEGEVLLELNWNRIRKNPGNYKHQSIQGGFRILDASGEHIMEVRTEIFPKGYLTYIKASLFDEKGELRITPAGESVQIVGDGELALEKPF